MIWVPSESWREISNNSGADLTDALRRCQEEGEPRETEFNRLEEPKKRDSSPEGESWTWKQSYPKMRSTEPLMEGEGVIENQRRTEWLTTSTGRDWESRGKEEEGWIPEKQRKRWLARQSKQAVSPLDEIPSKGVLEIWEEGVTQLGYWALKRKLNWRNNTAESLSWTVF